jgi:MFS family permease/spermidine synthase
MAVGERQIASIGSAVTPPWLLMFTISGATIAYEILLIRWLSIVQWYHFAFLVVSLALLAHGVSGSLITIWIDAFQRHYTRVIATATLAFALGCPVCAWLSQHLDFNSLEIFWDPWQWLRLLGIYLCLLIPFFFAATVIALTLRRFPAHINSLYAADLVGAGIGAIAASLALYFLGPGDLVWLLVLFLIPVLALTQWHWKLEHCYRPQIVNVSVCIILLALAPLVTKLQPTSYKPLTQALRLPETTIREQRHSPFGWLALLQSPVVPLRITPGLSFHNQHPIPKQLGLFVDGDGPFAVNLSAQQNRSYGFLRHSPDALAFQLSESSKSPRVLLIGFYGNGDLLQTREMGRSRIDIVEPNRQLLELMINHLPKDAGTPSLNYHHATVRGYLSRSPDHGDISLTYDLIKLPTVSRFGHALVPEYRLTREAFETYWRHLSPGGFLVINSEVQLPARMVPKLLNTLLDALNNQSITAASRHLLILRSWNRVSLFVSRSELSPAQIQTTQAFAKHQGFDVVYYPGILPAETNRFNRLLKPEFHTTTMALLSADRESFVQAYPFDISASTDDQPYFFRFIRWQTLKPLWNARESGGLTLISRGYPVLILALLIASFMSIILVLTPLSRLGSSGTSFHTLYYFGAIGLGFLMVEIVLLQWLVLFLSTPTLSAAVTMGSVLVFAGLGSLSSKRVLQRCPDAISWVPALTSLLGFVYCLALPELFDLLDHWSLIGRLTVSTLVVAPLAWLMGMPMPMGLSRLAQLAPDQIPWAWGINGCASVISAIITVLLILHWGFKWTLAVAFGFYLLLSIIEARRTALTH